MKRRIIRYSEIDSTNTAAKKLLAEGVISDGAVIAAERQTQGRGRNGREWLNTGGALLMSVVTEPGILTEEIPLLNLCAAVAVKSVLQTMTNMELLIKWPNDIITEGNKKLCGILSEGVTVDGRRYAIIGIGINVNADSFPDGLLQPATSVFLETGRNLNTEALLNPIADELSVRITQLISAKQAFLMEYADNCVTIGARVEARRGGTVLNGVAAGIDASGGLIILLDAGRRETVYAGDVYIRSL